MEVAVTRPSLVRGQGDTRTPATPFTAKIAEDIVNTTPRHDDQVPISSSSWTALRSVGCEGNSHLEAASHSTGRSAGWRLANGNAAHRLLDEQRAEER
jgi:hypothetical protein